MADEPLSPLMADILTRRAEETAAATNAVIADLQRRLATAEAKLEIIGERVGNILAEPYAPNTYRLEQAVFDLREQDIAPRRDLILRQMYGVQR